MKTPKSEFPTLVSGVLGLNTTFFEGGGVPSGQGTSEKLFFFLIIASLSIQSDNCCLGFANKIKFGGVKHLKTQGQLHEHPGWVQHFNMQC